jgi:hypothetical protein
LERASVVPLIAPIGISFTLDNNYLLTLGADGVLYKYSLADTSQVRQLKVYDSATVPIGNGIGIEMFEFLSLDGRDNIVLTAGSFEVSYIIDMEEFAFRAAIPSLGAFNEEQRMFAQYGLGIKIRSFYNTAELVEMAHKALNGS